MEMSAPCRSVMLTMGALGLKANMKPLNLMAGDQMKPEFVAINPQHCVPTLVDGDLKLWESRAICTYLASQYGKDDSLYPKCPKKRAQVDRFLYFDMGTLYHRFGEYVYPVLFNGQAIDKDKLVKVQEALGWLNGYLEGQQYAVGDKMTVADFVLVASVATFEASGIDMSDHSNVTDWLARCKQNMTNYESANDKGAKVFGDFVKSKFS